MAAVRLPRLTSVRRCPGAEAEQGSLTTFTHNPLPLPPSLLPPPPPPLHPPPLPAGRGSGRGAAAGPGPGPGPGPRAAGGSRGEPRGAGQRRAAQRREWPRGLGPHRGARQGDRGRPGLRRAVGGGHTRGTRPAPDGVRIPAQAMSKSLKKMVEESREKNQPEVDMCDRGVSNMLDVPGLFTLSHITQLVLSHNKLTSNLDLTGQKQVFKAENNPWVTPIADQFQLGVSHVFEYIRSETYKYLYGRHMQANPEPPKKNNDKSKKISRKPLAAKNK
uniref:Ras suppressor protein 1 n=1 Tax=Anser brachyrhynchus TaxID=132585 RepID=A0A8B9CHX0_9AVES